MDRTPRYTANKPVHGVSAVSDPLRRPPQSAIQPIDQLQTIRGIIHHVTPRMTAFFSNELLFRTPPDSRK